MMEDGIAEKGFGYLGSNPIHVSLSRNYFACSMFLVLHDQVFEHLLPPRYEASPTPYAAHTSIKNTPLNHSHD
jgi:hypothetical protein